MPVTTPALPVPASSASAPSGVRLAVPRQPKATPRRAERDLAAVQSRSAPAVAVPRDPTWYSARELDELPRPLRPIRPPRVASLRAQGRVVLQLAIDERGTVIDATVIGADARAELVTMALAAGRGARFHPGAKGGRIVKSKVLIELTFAPDGSGDL